MAAPPFALVVAPRPVYTNPVTISPTQFVFNVPADPAPTSIALFLTPETTLPQDTLAGIYIQLPWAGTAFRLLGALSTETSSAIFTLPEKEGGVSSNGSLEYNMSDATSSATASMNGENGNAIVIGISIEPVATLLPQISTLPSQQLTSTSSNALVYSNSQPKGNDPISTKVLAQRIIGNAFNFLASFSGSAGPGGEEVVPLKSFRDWWTKFEKKIQMDPGFLEREVDS